MTDVSPYGLYTLSPFRNLLASSVPCIALSHLEMQCKLCRCIQTPWYETLYHKKASLWLPQNNHHTYIVWHFHSHSEIYCHATSSVPFIMTHIIIVIALHDRIADIVFVAQPPFIISYTCYARSLHILVHCQRHSYRVIFCYGYQVVIFISFEL